MPRLPAKKPERSSASTITIAARAGLGALAVCLILLAAPRASWPLDPAALQDQPAFAGHQLPTGDPGSEHRHLHGKGRSSNRLRFKFSDLSLEFAHFPKAPNETAYQSYVRAKLAAHLKIRTNWDALLGVRLENWSEYRVGTASRTRLAHAEGFIRFRNEKRRVTLGSQILSWGLMDVQPPTDQIGRLDLNRIVIDDRFRQRRAVPAIRWEEFLDDHGWDIVLLPIFTPSILPHQDSIWYPLNRRRGQAFGFEPQPGLPSLIRLGSVEDDRAPKGMGGIGLRIGEDDGGLDWHVTAQRARRSRPYFEIDPAIQALLPNELSLLDILSARAESPTFEVTYPWSSTLGGDLAWDQGNSSWRLEAAWIDGLPLTSRRFALSEKSAFDWAVAWERLTGPGLTRVNLQFSGRHVFDDADILDEYQRLALSGDLDVHLARGKWRARLRFLVGFAPRETIINPEVSRLTDKSGTFFLGFQEFLGRDGTIGGFFDRNDMLKAGWRTGF